MGRILTCGTEYDPHHSEVRAVQNEFLSLMRKLAPDLTDEMARRAMILDRISLMQPVGRRQLAGKLNMTEREIRNTASILKDLGYIELNTAGMVLTERSSEIIENARNFCKAMSGLNDMESTISRLLDIERVIIVAGNTDEDPQVLQDLGRTGAMQLKSILQNGDTLAVTGGSTIAMVAQNMSPYTTPLNVMVVPARGGLGRSVATQANTLAAEIGAKLGGHHRLIHLPDHMDEAAKQEMLKLAEIREVIDLLERADIILHGIGTATQTMKERKLSQSEQKYLTDNYAAGESFGSYFTLDGTCLLDSSSIGIDLAKLSPKCRMIAVAGGARKAEAIISVMRHYRHTTLITDEGAAERIIRILS